MSQMNSFCHLSSLNGWPAPVPLGTVSASIKPITSCALALPFGVRLTGQESVKLAPCILIAVDAATDAAAGRWRQAELVGKPDHVLRRPAGDCDQRVLDG